MMLCANLASMDFDRRLAADAGSADLYHQDCTEGSQ
jgi:hypothetical protein